MPPPMAGAAAVPASLDRAVLDHHEIATQSLNSTHALSQQRWALAVAGSGAAAAVALARGRNGTTVATVLLGGAFAVAARRSREIMADAVEIAHAREEEQLRLARARLGQALSGAHDAVNAVGADLGAALLEAPPEAEWRAPGLAALRRLDAIGFVLRGSRELREVLSDEHGRLPIVGGHARQIRSETTLKPYHGTLGGLPLPLRGAVRQVGLVLDEVRVLHNADIERSVFVMTLASRAALVTLAPLLGGWTVARVPLEGGWRLADAGWVAASAIAVVTAAFAPSLVDRAMEDSAPGRQTRGRQLRIEVPIAVAAAFLSPCWTVVVFASGWTNWWQRQTPHLAFDWRKLAAFVAAVVALQSAGLAVQGVGPGAASREIALALLAIAVTGGSYGAMLPLSAWTALSVLIGDSQRSLRTLRGARDEMLACARDLDVAADAITVAAPDAPTALRAAATARQAARQLDRAADRAARRGLLASQVAAEVAGEAIARSYLPRRRSRELEGLRRAATARGAAEPAYATEPIFDPPGLANARVRRQRAARVLRSFIEHALNEAGVHGTGAVRILWIAEGEVLVVRVGNRMRAGEDDGGTGGEGGKALTRLGRRLPRGDVTRGERPPRDLRVPGDGKWWTIELRCAAEVLECYRVG